MGEIDWSDRILSNSCTTLKSMRSRNDVLRGFGNEVVRKLRKTAYRYDCHGLFQLMQYCSFLLRDVWQTKLSSSIIVPDEHVCVTSYLCYLCRYGQQVHISIDIALQQYAADMIFQYPALTMKLFIFGSIRVEFRFFWTRSMTSDLSHGFKPRFERHEIWNFVDLGRSNSLLGQVAR